MTGRDTFVLRVYEGGACVVEEVRTGRRAVLDRLSDVADQIACWLAESRPERDR